MGKKQTADAAMRIYEKNGEIVQNLLDSIVDLVPEEQKAKAEELGSELEMRMFYADYLCDVNGRCRAKPFKCQPLVDYNVFANEITSGLLRRGFTA